MSDNTSVRFETIYTCENCGADFDDDHVAKTRVVQETDGVVVIDVEASFGDNRERVVCPICELTECVRVDDRTPTE